MHIKVTKVDKKYVLFESPCGEGIGHFTKPYFEEGDIHSVEFDFIPDLITSENSTINTALTPGFHLNGNATIIVGTVEGVDPDDMISLRIDTDCVIITNTNDKRIKEGDVLEVRVDKDQLLVTSNGGSGY